MSLSHFKNSFDSKKFGESLQKRLIQLYFENSPKEKTYKIKNDYNGRFRTYRSKTNPLRMTQFISRNDTFVSY